MLDNGFIALFWLLFHVVRDGAGSRSAWKWLIGAILVLVVLPIALIVGLVLLVLR